ncbi:MAG: hypothetical protein DRP64_21020 [Verrucomicrobia bacterium]|nr:MAG: hypothetical protein DRP64_21020 [Verrucomicrobiota bacterium]
MSVEEKKNRLKKLVGNEQFISGIYNYCDRWCERCTLRTRCLSFAMDPDLRTEDSPRTDPDNEAFWQGIHENFQLAFELLLESAEEWGIDLNALDDPVAEEMERRRERRVEKDPLQREAMAYAEEVGKWMEKHENALVEAGEGIEREIRMELPNHDPIPGALALHDAVEVVRWYQFFLYPRISRALMGLVEDDRDMMDDVLGTAKITLIAIERSLGAWQTLGQELQLQDDVLDIQIRLARIRKELENRVPGSLAFIRPGFDE